MIVRFHSCRPVFLFRSHTAGRLLALEISLSGHPQVLAQGSLEILPLVMLEETQRSTVEPKVFFLNKGLQV